MNHRFRALGRTTQQQPEMRALPQRLAYAAWQGLTHNA